MHVQGVVEARDGHSWLGHADLPHLPLAACPPVFGQPTPPDGTAIASGRGVPDEHSDLLRRRYFKDVASVYGNTGPWRHAIGETWVRADELPDSVRADDRWSNVCDALGPAEDEYGPANVRVVVWFED